MYIKKRIRTIFEISCNSQDQDGMMMSFAACFTKPTCARGTRWTLFLCMLVRRQQLSVRLPATLPLAGPSTNSCFFVAFSKIPQYRISESFSLETRGGLVFFFGVISTRCSTAMVFLTAYRRPRQVNGKNSSFFPPTPLTTLWKATQRPSQPRSIGEFHSGQI